jgi:hypothetical protein
MTRKVLIVEECGIRFTTASDVEEVSCKMNEIQDEIALLASEFEDSKKSTKERKSAACEVKTTGARPIEVERYFELLKCDVDCLEYELKTEINK